MIVGVFFGSIQIEFTLLFLLIPILNYYVALCFLKFVSTKIMIRFLSLTLSLKWLSPNLYFSDF